MTPLFLISVGMYLIGFPLLFWGIGQADKKLKNSRYEKRFNKKGANRNELMKNRPEPVYPKWKERIKFTRSDKRNFVLASPKKDQPPKVLPISRRTAYWLIRALGLVVAIIGGLSGSIIIVLASAFLFFGGIIWGYMSADKLMKQREAVYKRMFSVARGKLNQSAEYENNPQAVIRILEWRDYIKPEKVEFDIPDSFGEDQTEAFLKHYNQLFGRETAWVPHDNEETGDPGWDFDKGVVTIRAVPPLPTSAPWSEHYVLDEGVAWSFFPIGLGVEHGLELPNPKTGKTENVLGFDLSGEQAKVAKKFGLKLHGAITTSPMCLHPNTLILTSDGPITIKELSVEGEARVLSWNGESYVEKRMFGIQKTRQNAATVKVIFKNRDSIVCTPDHELLDYSTGKYIQAQDMKKNTKIRWYGAAYDFVEVSKVESNLTSDVYDGEVEDTHNFIIITDTKNNSGPVSSNCLISGGTGGGKSLASDTNITIFE